MFPKARKALQVPAPKLPNERDESPAAGKRRPERVMAKAADDLKQGRQDTDRGPETNRLARGLASGNGRKSKGKK